MNTVPPLHELIPHDHPMILLDRVESIHAKGITASVVIQRTSPFCEDTGVPAWIGIEYLGQAIAAYAGLRARNEGQPVRIGFLVSTRRYETGSTHFPIGSRLAVSVEAASEIVNGLQVFSGTIQGSGIDITTTLNVFMPDDIEKFLKESEG